MTQFYYLSSKSPLETGTFGEKKTRSRKGNNVFETAADEASITVRKMSAAIRNLSYPHQYEITSHLGDFGVNKETLNELDQKCLQTLMGYLTASIEKSFRLEFFTAWAGEEDLPAKKETKLALEELLDPKQLVLQNREKLILYRHTYS